jgi:hypothetical protein
MARLAEHWKATNIVSTEVLNLRESDHLEDPSVDGRIILRWIFMM